MIFYFHPHETKKDTDVFFEFSEKIMKAKMKAFAFIFASYQSVNYRKLNDEVKFVKLIEGGCKMGAFCHFAHSSNLERFEAFL